MFVTHAGVAMHIYSDFTDVIIVLGTNHLRQNRVYCLPSIHFHPH